MSVLKYYFLRLSWQHSAPTFILWSRPDALSDRSGCTKNRLSSNFCQIMKIGWRRVCSHMNFKRAIRGNVHTSKGGWGCMWKGNAIGPQEVRNGLFDLKYAPLTRPLYKPLSSHTDMTDFVTHFQPFLRIPLLVNTGTERAYCMCNWETIPHPL